MPLDFTPEFPFLPIVFLAVVAATAAAWAAWFISRVSKNPVRPFLLLIVRLVALLIFVAAAAGPGVVTTKRASFDKPVAVLLDLSSSTSGGRDEPNAKGAALRVFTRVTEELKDIGVETRPYYFAEGLYAFDGAGRAIGRSEPTGPEPRPDLRSSLEELSAFENPSAAVVISDGAWPAPARPPFPVFAFPAAPGPAAGYYPVSLDVPRFVLPGTSFNMRINFAGRPGRFAGRRGRFAGSGETPFRFVVYEGDVKVGGGTAVPGGGAAVPGGGAAVPGGGAAAADCLLTPTSEGAHFYRVVGEDPRAPAWASVEVLLGPLKVYYVSMWPDADTAFLKRAITANRAVECVLRQYIAGRPVEYGSGFSLADADVIVLANPRVEYMDAGFVSTLVERVAGGAGLLFYYSAYPPDTEALGAGPAAALSPIRPGGVGRLGAGGAPSKDTTGYVPGFYTTAVPEFGYSLDLGDPKTAAVTLWSAPDGSPVLYWMPYGRGKVMALCGGGLAEWELSRPDNEPGMEAFAGDIALFLYGGEKGLSISDGISSPGERLEAYVVSSGEPVVVVGRAGGETERLSPYELSRGFWVAEWEPAELGRYELTARRFGDRGLEVEKKEILVVETPVERRGYEAGIRNLKALVNTSGGRFYADGPGGSFGQDLVEALKAAPFGVVTATTELLPLWIGLTIFLAVLLVEWLMRRLAGFA